MMSERDPMGGSGFLWQVIGPLIRTAVGRYRMVNLLLTYVMSSRQAFWTAFVALLVLGAVLQSILGFVLIFIWLSDRSRPNYAPTTVALYEFFIWTYVFAFVVSGVAYVAGSPKMLDDVLYAVRYLVLDGLISYLFVDLGQPPRKRKRIKVSLRVSKPAIEPVVT